MTAPASRPDRASPLPFAGMIGMACVFFLIAASVLATPWYVVALLLVVWAVVLVVALRWFTPHPTWVPWLPTGLALLWFTTVAGGAAVFGWSG